MATRAITHAAIVLTGGLSSRMGVDKASLVVDGEALADRAVRVLSEAGISEVAVAGSAELPDPAGVALGPMAGIVSGWNHLGPKHAAELETVVVLACDLPLITAGVVEELMVQAELHVHGAVAHDGEHPQPLIAAYRRRALDAMTVAFNAGERSVRRCFADWDLAHVSFERPALSDADTPADLVGFSVDWPSRSQNTNPEPKNR